MHEQGEKKDKESERRSIVGGKTEQQKVIETKQLKMVMVCIMSD